MIKNIWPPLLYTLLVKSDFLNVSMIEGMATTLIDKMIWGMRWKKSWREKIKKVKLKIKNYRYRYRYRRFHSQLITIKLRCDSRFQRAFTTCICNCVFKIITWFEPTNVISLKTQPHAVNACVKTLVATQLKESISPTFCFIMLLKTSTGFSFLV